MKPIYLARHGQTYFNVEGRFQGAHDSELTAMGLQQARELGAALNIITRDEPAYTLWSSPLGRARQTAEIVRASLRLHPEIHMDDRLREVSFGSWDGLTRAEIEQLHPGVCEGADGFAWFFRSPDGEALRSVEERLTSWFHEAEMAQECHIVISHAMTGRILRGLYAGLEQAEALSLEAPHGGFFMLHDGDIATVPFLP